MIKKNEVEEPVHSLILMGGAGVELYMNHETQENSGDLSDQNHQIQEKGI